MRRIVVATLVICLGVVGTIAFLLQDDSRSKQKPSSVQVAVEAGEVVVSQKEFTETVRAGESIMATAAGNMAISTSVMSDDSLQIEPEPEATAEPTPTIPPGVLEVRVTDALGDRIRNATLEINGTVYDTTEGEATIKGLPEGSTALTANAEGYESAQKNVTLPSSEPVDIQLEYLCSF